MKNEMNERKKSIFLIFVKNFEVILKSYQTEVVNLFNIYNNTILDSFCFDTNFYLNVV